MTTTYIITFYTLIGALILVSFAVGYALSRQMFPHTKSQNHGNVSE